MLQSEKFVNVNKINQKMTNYRWIICALLFFATTVNYVDRQVLSLLEPDLFEKFSWTYSDYANITSAFQFCYAISMLFAGRFIDKLGTKRGYAWALIIWSIGAMMHAFANDIGIVVSPLFSVFGIIMPVSVIGFIVVRVCLGIGEAGNFPSAIKTTAEWFPKKERSLSIGIFNSGANIGAIVAPLSVPFILKHSSWEYTFIIVGAIGFLWLIFWKYYYDSPKKLFEKRKINEAEYNYIHSDCEEQSVENDIDKKDSENKIRWFHLLKYRQTWSFISGKFFTDGVWWFFLFWLPSFLKSCYGMTNAQMTVPLAVLYTMAMVGSVCGGWLPAYFVNKDIKIYSARMTAMVIIAFFPLVVLLVQPCSKLGFGYWLPIFLIGIGASAHQAWSANLFTTVSDMFPKKIVASVTGIGGMAGGMSGVLISKIGGWLLDYYRVAGHVETGYNIMFAFCAITYLLAWSVMKLLVPRFKPITLG